MSRKCVIKNYIPHETPHRTTFWVWFKHYERDVSNLFSIFVETMNEFGMVEEETVWSSIFIEFARFIYNSSSKYIDDTHENNC